ncbi:MAG: RDD family protein [Helicobacter sp.]|nr:RDD family protein [Helicobacter sp.]
MDTKIQNLLEREDLHLASLGARSLAYCFDFFLVFFVFLFLFWDSFVAFGALGDSVSAARGFATSFLLEYLACNLIYEVLFTMLYGATLGKIVLKIRIISIDYVDNPGFKSALLRAVLKYLGSNFFYVTYIMAFGDKYKRSLHDRISKTLVISC